MEDPDVPNGACICRPDDKIMAMGHAHYCVGANRQKAHGTRLPAVIEQMIVEISADPSHHGFRRERLAFNDDAGMRDAFLEALASPEIHVYSDQCDDEPGEICLRAKGRALNGSYWGDLSILLLDPWWSNQSDRSQALVDDVSEHWDRLQAAYAAIAPQPVAA